MSVQVDWDFSDDDKAKAEIAAAVKVLLRDRAGNARGEAVQEIIGIVHDAAAGMLALAAQGARASDADRKKLAGLFQTCLKDRDPRQVIFKDGREQTIGHYRLFDVWMKDEAFLVMSPRYDDYDHDIVAQEDAVRRIVNLAQNL